MLPNLGNMCLDPMVLRYNVYQPSCSNNLFFYQQHNSYCFEQ